MRIYGYVRVSSRDQNAARQIIAMQEFGVDEKQIYLDKQSGKDFQRPQYQKLLRKLRSGDTLVIKSIDRLGRNYDEILVQWRIITKQKKASIVVLDMPLLDTRQSRDLAGTLIADIVLQLLSYVAQTEREFIKQRQKEGIAAAKARGVKFGRAPLEKPAGYEEIKNKYLCGYYSARSAAKQLSVSHRTFLQWVEKDNPEGLKARKEVYGNMHIADAYLLGLLSPTGEDSDVCPGAGCDICDHCKPIHKEEQQENE